MTGWDRRHVPDDDPAALRVSRVVARSNVLGPNLRAVIWVQRCDLRCRGCINPEGHDAAGGYVVPVAALADALLEDPGLDGITLTGGEPFLQPAAAAALLDTLRSSRPDLSSMAYTGYRLEWLRRRRSDGTGALLERLDLLVDGPYVERLHAPLRWRGSSNQRLHALTPRHRHVIAEPDIAAGIEVGFDHDDRLAITGLPETTRFLPRIEALLASHGTAAER